MVEPVSPERGLVPLRGADKNFHDLRRDDLLRTAFVVTALFKE